MMKSLHFPALSLILCLIFACGNHAAVQGPKIQVDKLKYDVGTMVAGDKVRTFDVHFKNVGTAPLHVLSVRSSCSCTRPKCSNKVVNPKESGVITVTVDLSKSYRQGPFEERLKIESTGSKEPIELVVTGEVDDDTLYK